MVDAAQLHLQDFAILGWIFLEEDQFSAMDRDGSGTLSFKEAGSKFKAWGSVAGGDGEIDLDEFSNFSWWQFFPQK